MGKGLKATLIVVFLLSFAFGVEIPVYAIVQGSVEKVFVKVGDFVKKGSPIVKVSSTLYDAQIKSLQGKLKELELKRWKAQRDYERYKELYERSLLSETELEDRKLALEILSAQIEEVKGKIEELTVLRDYTLVKSPVEGRVVKILVEEGSFVNGSLTPQLIAVIEKR